jgi:sulfatase maturation enzyme AslB (radical SAM superfamily)
MKYPHPHLAINLLDDCNKRCKHCYRTAIPSDHGFKLNKQEALLTLKDASAIGSANFFTGGEPTIWQDSGMDFLSLIKRATQQNGRAAFLSNGFVFEDKKFAYEFVNHYLEECGFPLTMGFTVDYFHENYDSQQQKISFLDNLLSARDKYDRNQCLEFLVVSHWTNDSNLNIPIHVFERYAKKGAKYVVDDYMTWGRGSKQNQLSPYIVIGSVDKTTLGPYAEILMKKMKASGLIQTENDFEKLSNRELLSKSSVCGKIPNFLISWGKKYYYCIPQMGFDWFAISELGEMTLSVAETFFQKRPVIEEMQKLSIFGVLEKYQKLVGKTTMQEIDSMQEGIRFAGCSVCLKLFKEGILQKINQKIVDGR